MSAISGKRFEELYTEHWALVYALCKARLGEEEEALDAAQEVFLRKWRAIDSYDPARASFRTWLRRNAEHYCVDLYRKQSVRPEEHPLPEETEAAGADIPFEEGALTVQMVGECLDALAPELRQLVLMKEVEEYTWEEMAAITGLTVAQARVRTAQGITQLRELLAQKGMGAIAR